MAVHVVRDTVDSKVGDMLHLRERAPEVLHEIEAGGLSRSGGGYTGRHVAARITHIARGFDLHGVDNDHAILSLELYRTWVDGQPGPGDWSSDTAEPFGTGEVGR